MTRTSVVFGGVPTEPDVKRLMEAFPDIAPERVISYAEVAAVIGESPKSSRFRTVTGAWRRRLLRERNFRLEAERGMGFKRITEADRSSKNTKDWSDKLRRALQITRDQAHGVITTQITDEKKLHEHDHTTRVMVAHAEFAQGSRKQIAVTPPTAVRALPRVGKTG